jgi:hypothetical protein
MTGRQEPGKRGSTATRAKLVACAFGTCVLVVAFAAQAQDARPQVPNPAESPGAPVDNQPAAPPEPFKPGFIDAFGRWLEEGANRFKSDMQGAQEKFGNQARDPAKETTGTVIGLPNARVVTGRERCAAAPGAGPDCEAAAMTVCRGKGFQGGRSLDTQSEQKCPTKLLLEGRAPNNTECPTTIFVTRAMCQ